MTTARTGTVSRRRGLSLAAALLASTAAGPARAQDTGAGTPQAAVSRLDTALQTLSAGDGGFAAEAAALAPAVDGALDIETIVRNSVGLQWGTIPAAQQQALISVFRKFTVASYVSNFAGSRDTFAIVPPPRQAGDSVVVQTGIAAPGGTTTRIDYVMHQTPDGWKATDVLLDGTISRVAVQRSDFRSVLEDGGAAGLIRKLGEKVTSLSHGQIQP